MMKRNDEYNEIYLENRVIGIEYTYKNHRLGKERIIQPDELRKIEPSKNSDDDIFIRCGTCDVLMDYIHSLKPAGGKWLCTHCGVYVRETTVNNYISKLPDLVDSDYDDIY